MSTPSTPSTFPVPRTQSEISAAALDGDPMTGLEVQTAFDGDARDEARLKANFDGDPLTRDPSEHTTPRTAHERTVAALDGNPMTRPEPQDDLDGAKDAPARSALPTPWGIPSPRPPGY